MTTTIPAPASRSGTMRDALVEADALVREILARLDGGYSYVVVDGWRERARAFLATVLPALLAAPAGDDGLVEALKEIDQWSRAYPLSVFPEPDFEMAHRLLQAGGMTLDAISASNMRHVVEGVGKIARDALAAPAGRGEDGWQPTHRHKKRGSECMIVGNAYLQTDRPLTDMTPMIVYRDQDGSLWVRSGMEFNDGRFEKLPAPPVSALAKTTGGGG